MATRVNNNNLFWKTWNWRTFKVTNQWHIKIPDEHLTFTCGIILWRLMPFNVYALGIFPWNWPFQKSYSLLPAAFRQIENKTFFRFQACHLCLWIKVNNGGNRVEIRIRLSFFWQTRLLTFRFAGFHDESIFYSNFLHFFPFMACFKTAMNIFLLASKKAVYAKYETVFFQYPETF